jgi:hypothetical protein
MNKTIIVSLIILSALVLVEPAINKFVVGVFWGILITFTAYQIAIPVSLHNKQYLDLLYWKQHILNNPRDTNLPEKPSIIMVPGWNISTYNKIVEDVNEHLRTAGVERQFAYYDVDTDYWMYNREK